MQADASWRNAMPGGFSVRWLRRSGFPFTSQSGTVTLLPGIGSAGTGSGFFQDINPTTVNLGSAIVQSLFDASTAQLFVVAADGDVSVLNGDSFAAAPLQQVAVLDAFGSFLVAGCSDGNVGLFLASGVPLTSQATGFSDEPSALQILEQGNTLDVFVTQRGSDVPLVMSFAIPLVTELPAAGLVGEAIQLPEAELVLVATVVPAGLADRVPDNIPGSPFEGNPSPEVFLVFLPSLPGRIALSEDAIGAPGAHESGWHSETLDWTNFPVGANQALQQRLQRQQEFERWQEVLEAVNQLLEQLPGVIFPFTILSPTAMTQSGAERDLSEYLVAADSCHPAAPDFVHARCADSEIIEVGPRDSDLSLESPEVAIKEGACMTIGIACLVSAIPYLQCIVFPSIPSRSLTPKLRTVPRELR
jgi:hypothetical protein